MKYNFYAGPAILPQQVIKEASESALSFGNMGLSILEISHRSKEFTAVMEEAEALVRELHGLSDDYAVLFLTGGASSQFYMTAMNCMQKKSSYLDTGTWSTKAIKEAKLFGELQVVASSKDKNFNYIPKNFTVDADSEYLHLTANNTIFGTQIHEWPDIDVPMVSDMSSEMFSRPLPIDKFGIMYAGAQKNLGPAGVTLVIIRKDMLDKVEREIPTMLNYQTHIAKSSSFNTPPVFPIYVSMLVMRWVKQMGGVEAMQKRNIAKADALYNAIDSSSSFYGAVEKEDRSLMNVCFKMQDESREEAFLAATAAADCVGLKGHRSVGGFRASIYNAMEMEGINTLIQVMEDFDKNG